MHENSALIWLLGLKVRTQFYVPLRSSQDKRPPDVLRPFKAGILGSSPIGVIMVTVAQMVEQWIVVPPVASSSLVGHPMGR